MSRLDYPIIWSVGSRELRLNNHRLYDGEFDEAQLDQHYLVEAYDFSPLDIREQREGYHLLTGGDFGPADRQFRHISLRGSIVAASGAMLEDMEAELLAAFDIEHAQRDNPTEYGMGLLKHTAETAFSGPFIGTRVVEGFYCRPESYPVTFDRRGPGSLTRAFLVQLVTGYPYRCLFPEQAIVLSASEGWSKDLPNWSEALGGTSRLQLDIAHSAAGANNLTISDGTRSLVLDMTVVTSGVLTVQMWSKQIHNQVGTSKAHARTSGIDSFFDVPPGGCTISASNLTNVTSITARYHQSRA